MTKLARNRAYLAQKEAAQMTRRLLSSLTIIATLALAACGSGGGGNAATPHVDGFLAAPKLTQWNANPETVAPVVVALTGANCTGTGTAKVCTVTSSAPVGNDVWDVKTYSTAGGTGTPLSAAISVNANITQPGPNNISTTLYGVVSSLNFSPASAACLDGTACSGAVTLTARDPSNATIIGPGNNLLTPALGFDSVRLTCQAHLAAQSSSGAAVAQPYYAPAAIDLGKIAYDGVSLGASGGTLTCTAADSATATATFTLTTAATGSATWTLN